ncbi:MAG: hypothetical protein AAF401_09720 [Pseudomonadota bacterium]
MNDPRFVIPVEAEPFAAELDRLIDGALSAGIERADIAVVLEDTAGRETRLAEAESD